MKNLNLKTVIWECQFDELSQEERHLLESAINATSRSYAPYSKYRVGAALLLENGVEIIGCNQENAAYPAGLCAERTALFSAGVQYPDVAVTMLAIAARTPDGELQSEPVSPCGSCRQVILEQEMRFKHPIRIILVGQKGIFVFNSIKDLLPFAFSEESLGS